MKRIQEEEAEGISSMVGAMAGLEGEGLGWGGVGEWAGTYRGEAGIWGRGHDLRAPLGDGVGWGQELRPGPGPIKSKDL